MNDGVRGDATSLALLLLYTCFYAAHFYVVTTTHHPSTKKDCIGVERGFWMDRIVLGNELKDEALGTERIMTMMMARDFI